MHAVTGLSSGASFSYDANGNMIGRTEGGRVYTQTFDAENRLVSVVQQGVGTTTYIYNGDGQLTKQVNPGGTGTLYLGVVEYELNANGTTAGSTSYYAVPGARAVRNGEGLFYVLTDHLGSASVSLDHNGAVVAEMRYDAFGATRLAIGSMPGDRLYAGQIWAQVGLYYFNARWYSAVLGRWAQPDSIVPQPGNPQSLNRYTYVLNQPIKYVDPTGHREDCPEGGCTSRPLTLFDFGVDLDGEWDPAHARAVLAGVVAVANILSELTGLPPVLAFTTVYGISADNLMTFEWDPNCAECDDSDTPEFDPEFGFTHTATHIEFATMSAFGNAAIRAIRQRNNVVHELAHAFENAIIQVNPRTGQNFKPAREALPDGWELHRNGLIPGGTWRQSGELETGEVYADMFLAYVFDRWETERGNLTAWAVDRRDWMINNMPGFVALAVPQQQ